MKIIASVSFLFLSVVAVHGNIRGGGIAVGNVGKELGLPVQVVVKCKGLNMNKMDPLSMTIVAQVLEETYGEIKETNDSGSTVEVTEDTADVVTFVNEEENSIRTMVENLSFDAFWRCGSLCPRPKDDDFTAGSLKAEHAKAWENKFIAGLIKTRRNDFRAIEHCSIAMSTTAGEE